MITTSVLALLGIGASAAVVLAVASRLLRVEENPKACALAREMGIENFYKDKWGALGDEIVNPIGCADCHDPQTMNLTITRPALVEAFERQGRDIAVDQACFGQAVLNNGQIFHGAGHRRGGAWEKKPRRQPQGGGAELTPGWTLGKTHRRSRLRRP